MRAIERLLEMMRALRDPASGCPWDREQTAASIVPYTLEEAYELADAVERGDAPGQREELGDLLFHLVFYSQIASEAGQFGFADVVDELLRKLEQRHPHVFGDARVSSAAEQSAWWERHKSEKRRAGGRGLFDDLPRALPAMRRALNLQKRAAGVGFDWPGPAPVLDKLEEEVKELREARSAGADQAAIEDEIGDILFAAINCARHLGVDPESALRRCNEKFTRRFAYIERVLAERGRTVQQSTLDEMEQLWQAAKHEIGGQFT